MSGDEPEWRRCLIERVHQRDSRESEPFKALITLNNRLLDNVALLKAENLKLSVENQQIRTAAISTGGGGGKDSNAAQLAIYEKKLLAQQEELTELHKRRGENSQMIVDLNLKVEKLTKTISEKEQIVGEQKSANAALKAEVQMLTSSLEELKKLNITLLDEHKALQLEFSVLEEKLRATKDENISLLDRLMRHKMKDADKLNEENETFLRKRTDKVKSEIEDAVREAAQYQRELPLYDEAEDPLAYAGLRNGANFVDCGRECGGDDDGGGGGNMHGPRPSLASRGGSYLTGPNPNQIYMKFDAHDNESHAVRWSPVERVVATGGGDRKVKLWDVGKGSTEPRAVLGGSNAGINSVDFDSTGSYILGTSNDRGARVWTVADHRLRHTLTGHGEKVMAAKYFLEPVKVVTGSHDRTLKIWDLRSIACIETKFAGSCCNDLVTTDSLGSMIISGHYDKKIRFWDIRTEKLADDVLMAAKITSLDMSKDSNYLICSVRDDTIKLLDLRKNQVITSFSHENFKLSCDWARASFNMNGTKIACGSADGSIYIWNISGRLETTLKGHTSAVNAVSWSPHSNALASVCKGKRCIIYSDS